MEKFPHLQFVQKVTGKPRLQGGGEIPERTQENKRNRGQHSGFLSGRTSNIRFEWNESINRRESEALAPIEGNVIPVFIQLNPDLFVDPEFDLQSFGIEIISEEENGFIIGASLDSLRALEEKILGFITKTHKTGKIADFWNIIEGNREDWKPIHILSEQLYGRWNEIQDDEDYKVEVGVAFDKPLGAEPDINKQGGKARYEKFLQSQIDRDEALLKRQDDFENFVNNYGEITSSFVDLDDSFSCEVIINGKGLKDLVVNYQYVFEVNEVESVTGIETESIENVTTDFEVLPPD